MFKFLLQNFEKSTVKLSAISYQSLRYRGKFNSRIRKPRDELSTSYLNEMKNPVFIEQVPDIIVKCKLYNDLIDQAPKFTTKSAIDFDKDENKSETGGTEVKKTKEENDENLEEDNDYIDSSGYFDSGDVGGGDGGDGGDWFDNWFSD